MTIKRTTLKTTTALKSACFAIILLSSPALASDNNPLNIITLDHMNMFIAAVEDDENTDETVKIFKQYVDDNPNNSAVLMYYASLLASRAQHVWFPLTKIKLANQGLDVIDKMLEIVDDDRTTMGVTRGTSAWFESKILSTLVFLRLPNAIFQRRAQGMTMANEVITAPGFDTINPTLRIRILTRYAKELARDNKIDRAKKLARKALNTIKNENLKGYDEHIKMAQETLKAKPLIG